MDRMNCLTDFVVVVVLAAVRCFIFLCLLHLLPLVVFFSIIFIIIIIIIIILFFLIFPLLFLFPLSFMKTNSEYCRVTEAH